jgi:hypothetical protein
MLMGGIFLALTKVSRDWIPEKKDEDHQPIVASISALQLLMFEGLLYWFWLW